MKRMKIDFRLPAVLVVFAMSAATYADGIDLSTWSEDAYFNGTNWVLALDGKSVTQVGNNAPGFFLGPETYSNARFQGTMIGSPNGDDDYWGLVFGFSKQGEGLYDYVLYDWKIGPQACLPGGQRIAQATNTSQISLCEDLTGTNTVELASDFPGAGWAFNTVYAYDVLYTPTRITLNINNSTIFDVFGTFGAGQFGFFNHSQDGTTFQVSSITRLQSVPEPSTLLLFGAGLAGIWIRRMTKR